MRIPDDFGDFERRVRQSKGMDALRRSGARIAFLALGALIVLIGLFSSYYTVEPDGRAVIKRFGAVTGIVDPGLHFKLPFGIDTVHFVPTERIQKQEFGFRTTQGGSRGRSSQFQAASKEESLMLTGDLNVINVEWVVQYRISDPDKYLHRVQDQTDAVRDVSESVMRQVVGNRLGSDVLTVGRVAVAVEVKEQMQQILDQFDLGVRISAVELQDVTPPELVAPAFNKVNEARQEKEKFVNVAETERNTIIPRARGVAEKSISEAEAYATERINAAKGETVRFKALLAEYSKSPDITRARLFLEMIDEVMPRIDSLYVMDDTTSSPLPLLDIGGAAANKNRSGTQGGNR